MTLPQLLNSLLGAAIGNTDSVVVFVLNDKEDTVKAWRLMPISDVMAVLTINDLLPSGVIKAGGDGGSE
jgi:hypothetical protein